MEEHSLEEDRQLVDDEQNRLVVFSQIMDDLLSVTAPVASIKTGSELHTKLGSANLLHVLA